MDKNSIAPRALTVSSPDAAEDRYDDLSCYTSITYSCDQCGTTFRSPKEHYQHQRETHLKDFDVFECEQCDYATKSEKKLEKHVLRHSDEDFEYTEGVSEETFVPEGDDDSNSQGLQIDEGNAEEEHDFKSPLQIVMEMNQASNPPNQTMFPSDNMSSAFIAAMTNSLGAKKSVPPSMVRGRAPPNGSAGKPRCTPVREAVDPAKYMTVQEGDGIKYACSKCGNIYKWRKSLNKHWKEKHDGEVPDARSAAVTALTIPSRIGNSSNISHLMGMNKNHGVVIPGKAGTFMRPVASQSTLVRPQPLLSVAHGIAAPHFGAGLPRPSAFQARTTLPMKHTSPAPSPPSSASSFHSVTSSANFTPRPVALSPHAGSPGLPQPPAAHGHKPQPFISPPSSRKSSTSLYDEPFDEQEGVLDLSKKSNPAPVPTSKRESSPVQEQPIDFSRTSPPLKFPPPPLSADPSRRHLISPHHPGTAHSPIVIEPTTVLHCTMCSYTGSTPEDLAEHHQLHRDPGVRSRAHQCAECPDVFSSLDQLSTHFSLCHADVLQQKLTEISRDDHSIQLYRLLSMEPSQRPPSHTIGQETTCLVCGAYYQWQDSLAAHFSMVCEKVAMLYHFSK